jgi:glycosyltransferase involved in cell wall biosynthesis
VGAVCYRKNQNAFIRSLDPLAGNDRFKLVFLGKAPPDDPYAAEFLDLVAARPWCEFAGFADREKLKTWLRRASLLALPSLEDNCPMVVLEAMAAGLPVLAAKVGGVPELIEDGKTGLLCDPLDPASMGVAVGKMLDDADLFQKLALAAKQEAVARFHPLVIARAHLEIYREVLKQDS